MWIIENKEFLKEVLNLAMVISVYWNKLNNNVANQHFINNYILIHFETSAQLDVICKPAK